MSSSTAQRIAVRFAAPADSRRLVAIDEATWSPTVQPGLRPASGGFFRAGVALEDTLVGVVDGEIAGYLLLGHPTPHPASAHVQMVRGLAVDPTSQRNGVGRALLERAVTVATERGARKLSLRVLASNASARRLYEASGFAVEGILRSEFVLDGAEVDDVLMARWLQ